MAYEATAISSSTFKKQVATNAVDADPWTFALTEPEEYPSLTVTLSDIFTIKGIHLILQEGKVYRKKIYLSIYLSRYFISSIFFYRSVYQVFCLHQKLNSSGTE